MQSEDFQGDKMQEIQALAVEYETAEILKVWDPDQPNSRTSFSKGLAQPPESRGTTLDTTGSYLLEG